MHMRKVKEMSEVAAPFWMGADTIYYMSDDGKGTPSVEFEFKDEELYTKEEANEFWMAQGCELILAF